MNIDKLLTCLVVADVTHSGSHSIYTPIRTETFLGEAEQQADSESLDHIGWLYDNIKIILCTIVHYEQLVTVSGSAILLKLYFSYRQFIACKLFRNSQVV